MTPPATPPAIPCPYAELGPRERSHYVQNALAEVLNQLGGPADTAVIASAVARRLECGPKEKRDIAKRLLALAPRHPNARHDGTYRIAYGRRVRGWRWFPPLAAPAAILPQEAPKATVADVLDSQRAEFERLGELCADMIRDGKLTDWQIPDDFEELKALLENLGFLA